MSDYTQDDPPLNLGYADHPFDDMRNLFVGLLAKVTGTIQTDQGAFAARFWGEVSLYGTIKDGVLVVERLRRVALTGELVEPRADDRIGALSLAGPLDEPKPSTREHDVYADFVMQLHYIALSRDLPPLAQSEDAVRPQVEQVVANLHLTPAGKPEDLEVVLKTSGPAVPLLGAVQAVALDPVVITFLPPAPAPDTLIIHNSLASNCLKPTTQCAPGLSANVRRLPLRFINFSNMPTFPDVEDICKKLLLRACEVWRNKAALDLIVQPRILDGTPDQKLDFQNCNESDETKLPLNLLSPQFGTSLASTARVEVYLVNALVADHSGGITHDVGVSTAYVILALDNFLPTVANPNFYILAHELGHVIGLDHPGTVPPPPLPGKPPNPNCSGSWESIMKATGGVGQNPRENTLYNCRIFKGGAGMPVLNPIILPVGPTPVTDCFRPDLVDHFIADFPTHNGSEPAVPPLGQDLVSNSSVWNRRTNTPGGANAAGGPEHEEPYCTDPVNFMYVKLAYRTALRDPVNVSLYLALPGVGGASLVPLNQVGNPLIFDIPPAPVLPPAPGTTSMQSLSWTLPIGYPPQCSVYALSSSTDEPMPLSVTYATIATRVGTDNDVAQRNLNVQGCTPLSGQMLWTSLPYLLFSNPLEAPASLRLEVDTREAVGLARLALEVNDRSIGEIRIGERAIIPLGEAIAPEEHLVLRFRALLPPDLPRDALLPIDIRFVVDGTPICGYRHMLLIAPLSKTVIQVMDTLFGALRDVAAGFESDNATKLARGVAQRIKKYADSPENALDSLSRLSRQFAGLAGNLGMVEKPETPMVQRRLFELAGVLMSWPNQDQVDILVEQIRDLADRIQEPAGRLARARSATTLD